MIELKREVKKMTNADFYAWAKPKVREIAIVLCDCRGYLSYAQGQISVVIAEECERRGMDEIKPW